MDLITTAAAAYLRLWWKGSSFPHFGSDKNTVCPVLRSNDYSHPMANLNPWATRFSDFGRNRISLKIGNKRGAVGVCLGFSAYALTFGTISCGHKPDLKLQSIDLGFQSAVFHLCQRAVVPLLRNDRGRTQQPLFRAEENWQGTSYNFSFPWQCVQFWALLYVMRE